MLNDRRIAPRTELRAPLGLRISTFDGRLREVSTSGARIEHRERLVVGARVVVELVWDGEVVKLSGVVVRSEIVRRDGADLVHHSGVQFNDLDPSGVAVLEAIIFNAERVEGGPILKQAAPASEMPVSVPAPVAKAFPSKAAARPGSGSPFMSLDDDDEEQPYVILRLTAGRWSKEYSSSPAQPDEGLTVVRDQISEIDALQRTYETADPMTREMMRRAMGAQLGS